MNSLFRRIAGCLLLVGLLAGSHPLSAAANSGVTWGDPVRLSDPNIEAGQPALAVDLSGVVHVVWSQTDEVALRPVGEGDTIYYSSFDGENWSRPLDIVVAGQGLAAQFPEITVTPNGYLHLVYGTGGTVSALMHTSVHVRQARDIYAWSKPSAIASPAQGQHSFVSDSRGYIYLAYADFYTKNINFLMSKDNGETWGRELEVSAGLQRPDEFGIYPRLAISESGRIHLVWNVLPWPGRLAYYTHSDDDGQTWSEPWLFDSSGSSAYRQGFGPIVPDIQTYGGNQVHILWDGAPTVERNHIYSLDDGESWSQPTIVFPELSQTGRAGWNEMAFDAGGILHAVSIIGPLHASWDGLGWSASQDIALRAYTGDGEMMRIKVGLGNQVHVLWLDRNVSPFTVWYVRGRSGAAAVAPLAIPDPLPQAAPAGPTPTTAPALPEPTPTLDLGEPEENIRPYSPGKAIAVGLIPVLLIIATAAAVVIKKRSAV
ncbi:MAG: exo-alpha-sialidase [Anaerolineaceae bacterium]|nr:exo-alpha-sialidase [Anaerolineaceae bacterium]